MTDALSASPAINRKLLRVQLAPVDVAAFRFPDRASGHAGRAAALLQSVKLLSHLNIFERNLGEY
jgi:hypothetical protein